MKWNFFRPQNSLKAGIRLIRVQYNGVTVHTAGESHNFRLRDIYTNRWQFSLSLSYIFRRKLLTNFFSCFFSLESCFRTKFLINDLYFRTIHSSCVVWNVDGTCYFRVTEGLFSRSLLLSSYTAGVNNYSRLRLIEPPWYGSKVNRISGLLYYSK